MALVKAICTQCGANLEVDNTTDAAICQYCGAPFIVEKAINIFNNYGSNIIYANNIMVKHENKVDDSFKIANNVLVKYTGYDEIVTIPEGVTKIGSQAFGGEFPNEPNRFVKIVNLPSSCREIGTFAFSGCTNLQKINGLENILKIGTGAFKRCENLRGIFEAKKLKFIGSWVFDGTGYSYIDISNAEGGSTLGLFNNTPNLETVKLSSKLWKENEVCLLFYEFDSDIYKYVGSGSSVKEVYIDNVCHNYQSELALDRRMMGTELYRKARERQEQMRKDKGLCLYCGGPLKGLLKKRCTKCGREKKY